MNRKALLVALIVGAVGVVLLLLYQKRFETEKSGGEKVIVLSMKKTAERGTILTDDMLAERPVPAAYVEARAIRATEKTRVVGLKVSAKVQTQDTLMWSDVVTSGDDHQDLSTTLAPGMRAKTLRVSREDTSIGLIRPGDMVDVIALLGSAANPENKTAVVLMQRVVVVAVGLQMSNDSLDRQVVNEEDTITVSVSLQEAQVLDLAADRGKLSVALRRRDDNESSRGTPDIRSDSLLTATSRPASQRMLPPTKEINMGGNQ
jgi:pilus assembly protein CpaB